MKTAKTAVLLLLACCLLLSLPLGGAAQALSGACGDNLTWALENGTLTISGTGEMTGWKNWTEWYEEGGMWQPYTQDITAVVVGDGVTGIGSLAFYSCSNLTSVALPASVTSIGIRAFENCPALTAIAIPEGVVSIGDQAFQDCSGLTSVILPDGLTSVGKLAFRRCTGLTTLSVPASVTALPDSCFADCEALTDIYYPGDEIAWAALSAASGIVRTAAVHLGDDAVIPGAELETSGACGERVTWALENGTLTIAGTGDMADFGWYDEIPWYLQRESITAAIIEPGVTSIGDYAFYGCENMVSVSIPDGVTSVGQSAFQDCAGLTTVVFPQSVTAIRDVVFTGRIGLTSVTIPGSVTHIGWNAFAGCGAMDIYYGGSIEAWADMTFESSVPASATLHLGDEQTMSAGSMTASGDCGPYMTWSLENRTLTISGSGLMDNYSWITGESPWYDFKDNIDAIVIENGVLSIGDLAFASCSHAVSVIIPDSVISVGASAFQGCAKLESVAIPQGVSRIERLTFYGCSSLTQLALPQGVTGIGNNAFDVCTALTGITIPGSVEQIGTEAFLHCDSLTDIYFGGSAGAWAAISAGACVPEGANVHFGQ